MPDAAAGTELYVAGLAAEQQGSGFEAVIAAPGAVDASYEYDGLRVHRYAVSASLSLQELWGEGDPRAARGFARILDLEQPQLVHFHAFTSGVSLLAAQEVRSRRLPLVFTYHTATASCPRGTLLRWGQIPCDGLLLDHRCGACVVAAQGLPATVARVLEPAVRWAGQHVNGRSGGAWTALRLPSLVSLRNRCVQQLLDQASAIIALAEWTRALLVLNGCNPDKIALVRHGIRPLLTPRAAGSPHRPLRVGFLGRLDPSKGAHVLLEALERKPDLAVQLVLYGIEHGNAESKYAQALRKRARADARVSLRPALPNPRVPDALGQLDVLAVPSQWLETGPLVVLEAFAAGIPVLGSRLGGIAELVRDQVDGLLLDRRPQAWADALEQIVLQPELLSEWRQNLQAPRSMAQVAGEVAAVYRAAAP